MKQRLFTGPRILLLLLGIALVIAVVVAIRKPAVPVDVGQVTEGPLSVTIDDLGETRVRDLYTVSAPVTGQLQRVPLKPGDQVTPHSTVLARIEPVEPGPLDARSYAEAQANIRSLGAQLTAARSRIAEAAAEYSLAERELARSAELAQRGFVSKSALDRARASRDRGRAAVAAARQSAEATSESLEAAKASLLVAGTSAKGRGAVTVTSPVPGFVLRVPQESERVVVSGTPLVEVGDPDNLEIVTDLLSTDAVKVRPGAPVSIENWGGERPLNGTVRLVEPFGFTKISALGVEEQRVNVVIDFAEPRAAWRQLGHGYRATVKIAVWSAPKLLRVPISSLFRTGGEWSVFIVDGEGRARLRTLQIGRMNDEAAQVMSGLRVGDSVILHPSDKIADGVRVKQRD